jgi:hypothetical protein
MLMKSSMDKIDLKEGLASRCVWLSIIMLREKVILKITKCEIS